MIPSGGVEDFYLASTSKRNVTSQREKEKRRLECKIAKCM
jgi:hypothetical protein